MVNFLNRLVGIVLTLTIRVYRFSFSRLKSGRCAHGVLYGSGNSCSDRALRYALLLPPSLAVNQILNQFGACRQAQLILESGEQKPAIAGVDQTICCDVVLDLRKLFAALALGEKMAAIYGGICIFKYIIAVLYHSLSSIWGVGPILGTIVPSIIGATASQFWLIIFISIVVDVLIIQALRERGEIAGLILVQIVLSLFVIFVDPIVYAWLTSGSSGAIGSFLLEYSAINDSLEDLAMHSRVLASANKFFILPHWAIFYGLVVLINSVDNWSKDEPL